MTFTLYNSLITNKELKTYFVLSSTSYKSWTETFSLALQTDPVEIYSTTSEDMPTNPSQEWSKL